MKKFLDLFENQTRLGTKIYAHDYLKEGKYPIVDQSKKLICGYSNNPGGLFKDTPFVIFGDVTRIFKYIDFPCYLGADGSVILKVIDSKHNTKFLYYYLLNQDVPNTGYNRHYKFLKLLDFKEVSLEEQNKVVRILDSINLQIDQAKIDIEIMDELIKSRFIEMFDSCPKINLCELAEIIMGQSPDSSAYNDDGKGIPFFQGKADYGAKYTVTNHYTRKWTREAKKGYVLMSVRAPVGPVNIANVNCAIGRGLCAINAHDKKSNNEFIFNALNSMQEDIKNTAKDGATFGCINKNQVYDLPLPKTSLANQNDFSSFVEQVDKLKFNAQKRIDLYQELLNKKMDEYFN